MSEIGQQNVSTTQSRGYYDPYGDLLSVLWQPKWHSHDKCQFLDDGSR